MDEALRLYESVYRDATLVDETWAGPYAMYEAAMVSAMEMDNPHRCAELLNELSKVYGKDDYSFEMQMQFRLHLTRDVLSQRIATKH